MGFKKSAMERLRELAKLVKTVERDDRFLPNNNLTTLVIAAIYQAEKSIGHERNLDACQAVEVFLEALTGQGVIGSMALNRMSTDFDHFDQNRAYIIAAGLAAYYVKDELISRADKLLIIDRSISEVFVKADDRKEVMINMHNIVRRKIEEYHLFNIALDVETAAAAVKQYHARVRREDNN